MEQTILIDSNQALKGGRFLSKNTFYKITIIFLLSFLSALLYSQLAGRSLTTMASQEGDSIEHDEIAVNFLNGHGLSSYGVVRKGYVVKTETPTPQMRRDPLFALFLALIYSIFGHSVLAVMIAQFIIYGLICSIIYLIGKLVFSKKVAFWAAVVSASHPNIALTFSQVGEEPLATLFSVLSVFLLVFFAIKGDRRYLYLIASSIFLALSVLTRSILLLLPLFLIFYFLALMERRKALLRWTVFCLVFVSIVVVWPIRNYRVLGYFSFSSHLGEILYMRTAFMGNRTLFDPWGKKLVSDLDRSYAKMVTEHKKLYLIHKSEVEVSKILLRKALEKIRNHPVEFLIGALSGMQRMVSVIRQGPTFVSSLSFSEALASKAYGVVFLRIFLRLIYSLPYLLMVLAFILLRASWKKWWLMFIFVTYSILINALLLGPHGRHIITIYPYVILFALAFLMNIPKKKNFGEIQQTCT